MRKTIASQVDCDGHANIGLRMLASGIAISMGSVRSRDLTPEQNERLRPLIKRLYAEAANQTEIGEKLGMGQSTLSGFLSGRQGTSFAVAIRACALAGENLTEVLDLNDEVLKAQARTDAAFAELEADDLSIGSFLMKLRRMPGLEEWLEANSTKLTILQVARAMRVYDQTKPRSRADGQPLDGWEAFFTDALTGRLTRRAPGDVAAAEALETRQLSGVARRSLRATRKKR